MNSNPKLTLQKDSTRRGGGINCEKRKRRNGGRRYYYLAEDDVVGRRRADVAVNDLKDDAASESAFGEVVGAIGCRRRRS